LQRKTANTVIEESITPTYYIS